MSLRFTEKTSGLKMHTAGPYLPIMRVCKHFVQTAKFYK